MRTPSTCSTVTGFGQACPTKSALSASRVFHAREPSRHDGTRGVGRPLDRARVLPSRPARHDSFQSWLPVHITALVERIYRAVKKLLVCALLFMGYKRKIWAELLYLSSCRTSHTLREMEVDVKNYHHYHHRSHLHIHNWAEKY